jgi:hypothetical protein
LKGQVAALETQRLGVVSEGNAEGRAAEQPVAGDGRRVGRRRAGASGVRPPRLNRSVRPTKDRMVLARVVILMSIMFVSCRPYVKVCEVPVLGPQEHLVPVAWSRTYGECVELARPRIPVRYLYTAGNIELRIAVGDRWYPRLYIDAVATDGIPVTIVSEQVVQSVEAGKPVPVAIQGERYRYFVSDAVFDRHEPLTIILLDGAGRRIGEVVLTYELVRARDLAVETI